MSKTGTATVALAVLAISGSSGCMIRLTPKWVEIPESSRPPLVRLGEVTQTLTGTWAAEARAAGWGHRTGLLLALRETEAASYFATGPASLVMDIQVVSDHQWDRPRLIALYGRSWVTLGLLPLSYNSVWNVDVTATVRDPDRTVVGEYRAHSTATYDIWAAPPTILTLGVAGCFGENHGRRVDRLAAQELAAKLVGAIDADYARLAKWREAAAQVRDQQPLPLQVAGATYWVLYDIETVQAAEPTRRRYVLKVYRSRPARGATPYRTLVVGEQRTTSQPDAPWQWREPKSVALYAEGRLWYPDWRVEGPHERLASLAFKERAATASELFRHDAFPDLLPGDLNDYLISWKNRELGAVVRDASARELREHLDRIEHLIVKANEAAEAEKDAAQKLTAAGKPGAESHAQTARLYISRIAILKPILAAVKAEVANRAR